MPVGHVHRDEETSEFFEAAADGSLLLRRCRDGHHSAPTAQSCETCGDASLVWVPAAGRATLVSWTVTHHRARAEGESPTTSVLAIGELTEGPWWWSQLEDVVPADLTEGAPLRIGFRRASDDDEFVPVFLPG